MATESNVLTVTPPNVWSANFEIEGTAPLVMLRFSAKASMMQGMAEVKTPGVKKVKPPRNYQKEFEDAQYLSPDGWNGIPASAFRNALIRACSIVNFKMTQARMSLFVEADGFDADDGTPLVRITSGIPRLVSHNVRNATGVADIRIRPMWNAGWKTNVRLSWDNDQFHIEDVMNLLSRAGLQVGILEGRPSSRMSGGMGWGTFRVVEVKDVIGTA